MPHPRKDRLFPIADEGFIFILPLAFVSFLFYVALGWHNSAYMLFGLTAFSVYFFRDPEREIAPDPELILSPADGKVVRVQEGEKEGEPHWRVSIFLSIFNVHINRSPIEGEVTNISYREGEFKAAFDHDSSEINEQNSVTVENDTIRITFVQIAGLIARRIVCWVKPHDRLEAGERYGLIRFGSRMDIFLPRDKVQLKIKKGDRVRGGLSALGKVIKP
ncbi:MAG: phosphatidylserine decarboxylase family protein [bacterium]